MIRRSAAPPEVLERTLRAGGAEWPVAVLLDVAALLGALAAVFPGLRAQASDGAVARAIIVRSRGFLQ